MTKKYKYSLVILVFIFVIGLIVRFYRLNQNIPELYTDEVGHFYYQKQILDFSVNPIRWFSYLFFTATWFLDLNPFGVRFFSALYGSLSLIIGFFFAKTIAQQSSTKLYLRVGLVFSFLLAVLPWHFSISRLGHTHILLVTMATMIHLWLYLISKNDKQRIFSFLPFLIGAYYYPTLIIMSPLVLLVPIKDFLADKEKNKLFMVFFGLLFVLVSTWFLISKYQILSKTSRVFDLAIWRDPNVTADSNYYRGIARGSGSSIFSLNQDPEKISNKLLFNYPISVIEIFLKNYLSFFSVDNLFLKGDTVLRHSTSMVGNFYPFLLPFMLYGIFLFYSGNYSPKSKWILTFWVIASPLPAAITKDGAGYLLRAISLYPLLTYFCSLGLVSSFEVIKNKYINAFYILCLFSVAIGSIYFYFFGYFHVYPSLAKDSFEYGFKDLSDFQKQTNTSLLIIWNDLYPYSQFCFWQNLSYEECNPTKTSTKREMIGNSRLDHPLPKLYFSLPVSENDLEIITQKTKPEYIALSIRYQKQFAHFFLKIKPVKTIFNPDKTVSFYLYQLNAHD